MGPASASDAASRDHDAPGRPTRRLVGSLSAAVLLQWVGAGALLPLLPLYVRHRGGSDAVVGVVMAAFFVGAFVFQYGAGRLADRLGWMPVLVAGLAVCAAGSLLFLVPGPIVLAVLFRALQGAGSGASMVAALAMVARAVPLSHRGRGVGRLYGAELGGIAVGPALGSLVGVGAMHWLFLAAAVVSAVQAKNLDGVNLDFEGVGSADQAGLTALVGTVAAAVAGGTTAVAGGGSLPGIEIPSAGLSLSGDRCEELRRHEVPVIACARGGETLLDLRSVLPADDAVIAAALRGLEGR